MYSKKSILKKVYQIDHEIYTVLVSALYHVDAKTYLSVMSVVGYVETYLDDMCNNGHFSRWTSHGQHLAVATDQVLEMIFTNK